MRTFIALSFLATGNSALSVTPSADISSAGPLTHIWIGNDLSCQIKHSFDAPDNEFFPSTQDGPSDAGTFIFTSGTLYTPDFANHESYSGGIFNLGDYTPFTAVSQTAVTGSGTGGDPYQVITVVDIGATGLNVHQTDTYVVGNEFYSTQITINNTTGGTITGILYRAGDSFMGGSDESYGFTETLSGSRNAVGTSANANNSPLGKIEEWVPQTGGNNYYEAEYHDLWTAVGAHTAFPDTCQCTTLLDSGAGISWNFSIIAGGSATFSQDTKFRPVAASPTPTATATFTPTPTATFTPTPTATATSTATATATVTPMATATSTPTPTPAATATATATSTPVNPCKRPLTIGPNKPVTVIPCATP